MGLKKNLIGGNWNGKGFSVPITEDNIELLKKLGADVFESKKSKPKKSNDSPKQ
tara:strand:- start:721 stop:882 length:162 start_codon:yes stop_codon:yes gene_type:complete